MAEAIQEEIIQIVDEHDEVIDSVPKSKCYKEGLLHRCSAVYVLTSDGHVYLQRRASDEKIEPGHFDHSAAGHVNKDETYDEAAKRELKEEIGLDSPLTFVGKVRQSTKFSDDVTENQFISIYYTTNDDIVKAKGEEVMAVNLFTLDEAESILTSDNVAASEGFKLTFPVLKNYLDNQNQ